MRMQPENLWDAVIACRAEYDGIFYYGVKTTRIFCRPSCKSKTPKRENVDFFINAREAMEKGYRPCKRCRPDLLEAVYDPHEPWVREVRELLEKEYHIMWTLDRLSRRVGMSAFHLQRMFKKYTGMSPKQYLNRIRVEEAKRLLADSGQTITEICFAVGFPGLTPFNRVFRRFTGRSPRAYRKLCCRK
jgi:AraC family transcriptional regulator of adaptative response / methylphosphotriester-DNA alkyltransferase methyltransferase